MTDAHDRPTGTPEGHGAYGGTTRDDGDAQEEPTPADGAEEWADNVETGGEATS
ncbi:MAG: hypothetical protein ACLGI2_13960 [Acidimicrobiia bacterium]|jgi:hypothetical protein